MTATALVTRDGDVATIVLTPKGKVTSLAQATIASLTAALDEVEALDGLRALVIAGAGPTFVVGADIKEIEGLTTAENLAYNERLIDINERVAALAVPVIAAINGHAFGGGLELALACTLRVMSADALVGLPEVKLGILPGAGGVVRLPQAIGRGPALRIMLTGASVGAAEALSLGLVDEIAPAAEVVARAQALAAEIAARAPLAVQAIVAASRAGDGILAVHARLRPLLDSADKVEGVAAFIAKREPTFTGR